MWTARVQAGRMPHQCIVNGGGVLDKLVDENDALGLLEPCHFLLLCRSELGTHSCIGQGRPDNFVLISLTVERLLQMVVAFSAAAIDQRASGCLESETNALSSSIAS